MPSPLIHNTVLCIYNIGTICIHFRIAFQICECEVPSPIDFIEGFVREDEEYPIVCFGAREG